MRTASALLFTCALPALAAAQPPVAPSPSPARVAAMQKLSFMEGVWKGSAWMQMGPKREATSSAETVTREVGGNALLVKGVHSLPDGRVVHDTLGVLFANEDGTYAFHTWLGNGRNGVHQGAVKDGAFVWGMDSPGGRIRYTIRLDDKGRWFEIGERSADGAAWTQFFEMTLAKE